MFLHPEALQQPRQCDSPNGIDAIYYDAKIAFSNFSKIDEIEREDMVDVVIEVVLLPVRADLIVGNGDGLPGLGALLHVGPFFGGEELAFFVEELERVPFGGIMGSR